MSEFRPAWTVEAEMQLAHLRHIYNSFVCENIRGYAEEEALSKGQIVVLRGDVNIAESRHLDPGCWEMLRELKAQRNG